MPINHTHARARNCSVHGCCTRLFLCLQCLVLLALDLVLLHLAGVFLLLVEEVFNDVGLVVEVPVGRDDGDLGRLARQVAAVEWLQRAKGRSASERAS